MREWEAIEVIQEHVDAEDDCAVIPHGDEYLLLTTDMLHRETDLPSGVTPYTAGWRCVAVSLSDIAAMAGNPITSVVALGVPEFSEGFLDDFMEGAVDAVDSVGCSLSGGDLDRHQELTVVSTALGYVDQPVLRSGSRVGDLVCVTGSLGRTALALREFRAGNYNEANELFRFNPRVEMGLGLQGYASSMMDISDGLAVSLHQLSDASGNGFSIEFELLPLIDGVTEPGDAVFTGEDYEIVFTVPGDLVDSIPGEVDFEVIGRCVESGVYMDDEELPMRGYEHGG